MRERLFSWLCTCLLALLSLAATSSSSARPVKVVVECDEAVWQNSLQVAVAQIGVTERTGRNDGPEIKGYLASVRLPEGNPWCYALHFWSFTQVTDKPPLKRTGLVRAAWNDAIARGTLVPYKVEVGDFLVWGYATSVSGHIERVSSKEMKGGWVATVAGNTSMQGARGSQREGGGCYRRYRNIRHPLGRMLMKGLIGRSRQLRHDVDMSCTTFCKGHEQPAADSDVTQWHAADLVLVSECGSSIVSFIEPVLEECSPRQLPSIIRQSTEHGSKWDHVV